jgi:hypothetical protein
MQQIGFYCKTYCPLNMFRAPLCSSSGTQELYRLLLLVVHGSVKMENVTKVGEYWCLVSIMLSCVIWFCLNRVGCRGDSVWVSQVVKGGIYLWSRLVSVGQVE